MECLALVATRNSGPTQLRWRADRIGYWRLTRYCTTPRIMYYTRALNVRNT